VSGKRQQDEPVRDPGEVLEVGPEGSPQRLSRVPTRNADVSSLPRLLDELVGTGGAGGSRSVELTFSERRSRADREDDGRRAEVTGAGADARPVDSTLALHGAAGKQGAKFERNRQCVSLSAASSRSRRRAAGAPRRARISSNDIAGTLMGVP
jgi:hypothetical protein